MYVMLLCVFKKKQLYLQFLTLQNCTTHTTVEEQSNVKENRKSRERGKKEKGLTVVILHFT